MLAVVLSLLSLVAAAAGSGCCTPTQWEGDMGLILGSVANGNTSFIEGTMRIHYDAQQKMIVTVQNINYNGLPIRQTIIEDFNKRVQYTVMGDGCSSKPLGAWLPNCIPDNATSAEVVYGLGSNSVQARAFEVNYGEFTVYFVVTADTCVPLAEDVNGKFDGADIMEVITFANIKAGISNTSVFNIPTNCPTVQFPVPGVPRARRASPFHGYL
ncbi:uncharacterized protein LOC127866867 [Dreissena polymorpha]|uniref:Uncharacterized protein n=1 Tax=Dreissena polymorpha TaxID=45954 RepID=A0A9D4LSV1_DREPO|nr:uncharacterized protein LOC127866867 [Dreissena polymorpha]XP_052263652.1 uncharacterized protein LOC127866867 [Dreissena polymorpha]KAH3864412.1 hypothetical protein DPMN_027430 [Dreissena polymorpha]